MGAKAGSACLDENALVDIAQGKVKGDALAEAERHLATCDDCSETLAVLATVVNPTLRATQSPPTVRAPLACGTTLNDTYRLLRLIGYGAMGDVYEAQHLHLEGRRAIKILNVDPSEMAQARPRFMREAGIASALRHPNVVQVVDFNVTNDERPFLVMEFLEGQHFGDLIQAESPMGLSRVLELLTPVASALEAMHRRGIVHRDLKPQNIMLVTDQETGAQIVKVLDFGLAKRAAHADTDAPDLSRGRVLLGTPMYMAPEQAAGDLNAVGPAADQFALAALAYEMLSRRQPFFAESTTQVLHRVISVEPTPLRTLVPGVPTQVERAITQGLSKAPDRRFATVSELLAAMSAPIQPPLASQSRGPRARITGAAASLLVLAAGVVWASSGWFRSEPRRLANPKTAVQDAPPSPLTKRASATTGREAADSQPDDVDTPGAGQGALHIQAIKRGPITVDTTLTAGRAPRRGQEPHGTRRPHSPSLQPVPTKARDTDAPDETGTTSAARDGDARPNAPPDEPIDMFEHLGPPSR